MDSAGAVIVECPPVPLASWYRCRMMILGVDLKYRMVFSGSTPLGKIMTVQPGVTVQLVMQAVNGGAQSVASEQVVFTVPMPSAQAEVAAPEAEIAPLLAVGTNGHSNGKVKALRS